MKRLKISGLFVAALILSAALAASAISAQAQVVPQEGAINTSRSNLKNTFRTGAFDALVIDLSKASGEKVASRRLADVNNDGKLSDAECAFDFGVLPGGDYVLTVSLQGQIASLDSNLKVAWISIAGAVGGKVEKDWDLETGKVADVRSAENQRNNLGGLSSQIGALDGKAASINKLGTKIDSAVSELNERANANSQSGVAFKADGKTSIAGKLTLPNGGVVIKSIGKSN